MSRTHLMKVIKYMDVRWDESELILPSSLRFIVQTVPGRSELTDSQREDASSSAGRILSKPFLILSFPMALPYPGGFIPERRTCKPLDASATHYLRTGVRRESTASRAAVSCVQVHLHIPPPFLRFFQCLHLTLVASFSIMDMQANATIATIAMPLRRAARKNGPEVGRRQGC